jgi:hypothetical protein
VPGVFAVRIVPIVRSMRIVPIMRTVTRVIGVAGMIRPGTRARSGLRRAVTVVMMLPLVPHRAAPPHARGRLYAL